jgi:formylmethanofuran dehydrogenase subunit D
MTGHSKIQVTLVTGRTIEQGVGKEKGKESKEYFESVAICHVDPQDLKKLGINSGNNVQVSTNYGSVILKAVESPRGRHQGVIYVPYGPWANIIVDPETDSVGMPSLKGIPAEVQSAADKPVLSLSELLKAQYRMKKHDSC